MLIVDVPHRQKKIKSKFIHSFFLDECMFLTSFPMHNSMQYTFAASEDWFVGREMMSLAFACLIVAGLEC